MYDMHVHTAFSHDGKSTVEEYAALLDQGVLEGIGFTEHVDFMPECGGFGLFHYQDYMSEVSKWKERGYALYAGAEVDYAQKVDNDIRSALAQNPYDYRIFSIHVVDRLPVSTGVSVPLYADRNLFLRMLEGYYREVRASLQMKEMDVAGHIGIYQRYLTNEFMEASPLRSLMEELDSELAQVCARSDKLIEVNTSGLFSPSGLSLPRREFLEHYYRAGGRFLCMGSDAHNTAQVLRGFGAAGAMLKDIGFTWLHLPWDREKRITL